MRGFIDLHCHWIPGVDDGAPTIAEGVSMLQRLHVIGFDFVLATPHMRPGMFDNSRDVLEKSFTAAEQQLAEVPGLPRVGLSSEHYFDDVVFERLLQDQGLPYPGGRAVLLEFYDMDFPRTIEHQFAALRRKQLVPIIAHPERYRCMWREPDKLERLIDAGCAALLDAAALVGKYGRAPQRCAEELLERGLYHAACSDAHRQSDVAEVARAMKWIERAYDSDEVDFLFRVGPSELLAGRMPG
jgi:protein-tyrosine phosphatase